MLVIASRAKQSPCQGNKLQWIATGYTIEPYRFIMDTLTVPVVQGNCAVSQNPIGLHQRTPTGFIMDTLTAAPAVQGNCEYPNRLTGGSGQPHPSPKGRVEHRTPSGFIMRTSPFGPRHLRVIVVPILRNIEKQCQGPWHVVLGHPWPTRHKHIHVQKKRDPKAPFNRTTCIMIIRRSYAGQQRRYQPPRQVL